MLKVESIPETHFTVTHVLGLFEHDHLMWIFMIYEIQCMYAVFNDDSTMKSLNYNEFINWGAGLIILWAALGRQGWNGWRGLKGII